MCYPKMRRKYGWNWIRIIWRNNFYSFCYIFSIAGAAYVMNRHKDYYLSLHINLIFKSIRIYDRVHVDTILFGCMSISRYSADFEMLFNKYSFISFRFFCFFKVSNVIPWDWFRIINGLISICKVLLQEMT